LPNLLSLTTYCVCPEPRPLPSTGITRLQRYYGPLRHPKAPGLSLAGVRLLNRLSTSRGFPCCVRFPGVHAVATTPAQRLSASSARFLSRISLPDKGDSVGPRIGIFEDCSAFIHITACTLVGSPKVIRCIEGFSHFVTSMTAPTTSGWSICRVRFTPTGRRRLFTAHTLSCLCPPSALRPPVVDLGVDDVVVQKSDSQVCRWPRLPFPRNS
jgi:hypothetical protein